MIRALKTEDGCKGLVDQKKFSFLHERKTVRDVFRQDTIAFLRLLERLLIVFLLRDVQKRLNGPGDIAGLIINRGREKLKVTGLTSHILKIGFRLPGMRDNPGSGDSVFPIKFQHAPAVMFHDQVR